MSLLQCHADVELQKCPIDRNLCYAGREGLTSDVVLMLDETWFKARGYYLDM